MSGNRLIKAMALSATYPLPFSVRFASATSGDKVNNAKFSPCSVNSISAVLYEVLQQTPIDIHRSSFPLFGKKRNCFQGALIGGGLVQLLEGGWAAERGDGPNFQNPSPRHTTVFGCRTHVGLLRQPDP